MRCTTGASDKWALLYLCNIIPDENALILHYLRQVASYYMSMDSTGAVKTTESAHHFSIGSDI